MPTSPNQLRTIRKFTDLVRYLETELDWPVAAGSFDDLTFEYQPAELGLKAEDAVKIKKIHQLRPLVTGQPWGIFFIEFEKKKLPVVVLRCILSHLVVKKRQSANKAEQAVWNPEDLLFISAFGDEASDQREIAFAHFHQQPGDLPTLRVLGWDGGDTPLKLDYVAGQLKEKLHWPQNPKDQDAWRTQWRAPFRHRIGHVIRTADSLAEVLAALARGIRDRCKIKMRAESEHGALTKLYKGFQTALIHDLKPDDFADTYAQTITYGLLTAAISRTEMSQGRHGTVLYAENVTDMVPVTNPFLKEMLQTFLKVGGRKGGIDFDELGIQDVVELLRGEETDLPAILRDFGNKTRGEDPVIHFYEHFLSAYNKQLKIQRGVFYTPQPVVSYIVRSVHELLQTEFGLEDGLASTATWGELAAKNDKLKIPDSVKPGEMFVQILDPATGTATFLVEVIDVIYRTLKAKWDKGGLKAMPKLPATSFPRQPAAFGEYWNQYVPLALLPRLHGYELMMAPYAIAHMKIGLKLHETGYHFGTEERARIYLTNALEPKVTQLPQIGFDALAHEAAAVNEIKWYKRFTVVIGNPPYANFGQLNKIPFILDMLEDYKRGLDEKKINLDDDFIKFVRFSQYLLKNTGTGILGFITNNVYLEGLTHRQMRKSLLGDFGNLRLLNLHGDSRKKETAPDGSPDENVFDIMQGVAVTVAARKIVDAPEGRVFVSDLWGTRDEKYKRLVLGKLAGNAIVPKQPNYFLKSSTEGESQIEQEYSAWWKLSDFSEGISGIETKRDHFAIDQDRAVLEARVKEFVDGRFTDAQRKEKFLVRDNEWVVEDAVKALRKDRSWEKNFVPCLYRPFDPVWIIYSGVILARDRGPLMAGMIRSNVGLIAARQSKEPFAALATNCVCTHKIVTVYDRSFIFPLYSYASDAQSGVELKGFDSRRVNYSPKFTQEVCRLIGLKWISDGKGDLQKTVGPEDIFHYAYGVFHSPGYRSRYAEFLKIDFPRLPLTGNLELFHALARLGGELTALHLLESPKLEKPITEYIGGRNPVVEKVSWSKNTVWLDKAQTTGFKGVREDVWNFHIGGYQVCEKWLKDRKGRNLSADDRTHYQKIIVALSETIRLMSEIDAAIAQHGGWPLK